MAIESGIGMTILVNKDVLHRGFQESPTRPSEPSVRGMFHRVKGEGWPDWYDGLSSGNRILVDREIKKTFSYRFYIFHLAVVRFLRWCPWWNRT